MATIATVAMTSQAQDLMTPEILWSMHRLGARSINAEGTLELNLFNDRLDIGCRVKSLSEWEKQYNNQ